MNTQQLLTVLFASALVIVIIAVVIMYELRARAIRSEYENAAEISQELATDTASDPIVGSWMYTDITLNGLKALEVDQNLILEGEKYGTVELTRLSPGLYKGTFRPGDYPTTVKVVGDVLYISDTKYAKMKP